MQTPLKSAEVTSRLTGTILTTQVKIKPTPKLLTVCLSSESDRSPAEAVPLRAAWRQSPGVPGGWSRPAAGTSVPCPPASGSPSAPPPSGWGYSAPSCTCKSSSARHVKGPHWHHHKPLERSCASYCPSRLLCVSSFAFSGGWKAVLVTLKWTRKAFMFKPISPVEAMRNHDSFHFKMSFLTPEHLSFHHLLSQTPSSSG